jgi:chromosome segregation ATPase
MTDPYAQVEYRLPLLKGWEQRGGDDSAHIPAVDDSHDELADMLETVTRDARRLDDEIDALSARLVHARTEKEVAQTKAERLAALIEEIETMRARPEPLALAERAAADADDAVLTEVPRATRRIWPVWIAATVIAIGALAGWHYWPLLDSYIR